LTPVLAVASTLTHFLGSSPWWRLPRKNFSGKAGQGQ